MTPLPSLCVGLEGSCDLPIPASTCLLRCFEPKDGKIEKRRGHRNNTLHVPVMIGPEHLRLSSILSFVLGDDAESVKAWRFCIQDVMDALDSKHTRTVITARQDASEVMPRTERSLVSSVCIRTV